MTLSRLNQTSAAILLVLLILPIDLISGGSVVSVFTYFLTLGLLVLLLLNVKSLVGLYREKEFSLKKTAPYLLYGLFFVIYLLYGVSF